MHGLLRHESVRTTSRTTRSIPGRRRLHSIRPGALALLLLAILPAHADVTRTDVQVAARALSFVSNPLAGEIAVGIVYSKDSQQSARQAETLHDLLAGGMRIGALEMQPVMVEVHDVANAQVDLFFLTEHVTANVLPELTMGARAPRLCVTTDIEKVRAGACTIGVRSRPKVEVFVSRSAAAASNITFSTVFRVMITEL